MARFLFDPAIGEMVPAAVVYARRAADRRGLRSHLSAPRVMSDNCEVQSMSDGKIYTSKAALRQSYRDQGVIEVGNDSSLYRDPTARWSDPDDGGSSGASGAADAALWDQMSTT